MRVPHTKPTAQPLCVRWERVSRRPEVPGVALVVVVAALLRSEVVAMSPRTSYWLAGGAVAGEVVAYLVWRPRMLRWGASDQEVSGSLPGDDRTPTPRVQSTRAITIEAPPERVWPWLMQMGIGRAGFYSHDWVERLMCRARYVEGRRSATRIHPELGQLRVGDTVPMGAGAFATVWEVKPYEHLVAQETFVLRPLPGDRTRLITRYRGMGFISPAARAIRPDAGPVPRLIRFAALRVPGVDLAMRALDFFVADPLHHYMETGMLTGIKVRAEQEHSHVDDDAASSALESVATTS
jgi:hypothetical protein